MCTLYGITTNQEAIRAHMSCYENDGAEGSLRRRKFIRNPVELRTKRRRRVTPTPPSLHRAIAEPVNPVLRLVWRYTRRRATGSLP